MTPIRGTGMGSFQEMRAGPPLVTTTCAQKPHRSRGRIGRRHHQPLKSASDIARIILTSISRVNP